VFNLALYEVQRGSIGNSAFVDSLKRYLLFETVVSLLLYFQY